MPDRVKEITELREKRAYLTGQLKGKPSGTQHVIAQAIMRVQKRLDNLKKGSNA